MVDCRLATHAHKRDVKSINSMYKLQSLSTEAGGSLIR